MAFQRPGMSDFTGVFGANQGLQRQPEPRPRPRQPRHAAAPAARIQPLTLPAAPAATYPHLPAAITNSVNMFDSEPADALHAVVHASAGSASWGSDTAFELRYVGSRHRQDWETVNINEININDNGFVNEFRKAQANLQANIAAGRGTTFAYTGAAGHVAAADLPRVLQRRRRARRPATPTSYTGAQLDQRDVPRIPRGDEPEPVRFLPARRCTRDATNGFVGNATFRNNAAAAGLPANFFVANPDMHRRRRT